MMRSITQSAVATVAALVLGGTAAGQQPGGQRMTAAAARIDPMTVSIQAISPADAHALKSTSGQTVLLLDIRSQPEVAFGGTAHGVDAVVPYADLVMPMRWDDASRTFALALSARFVETVQSWVGLLGGNEDTPILLLCRSGDRAAAAARSLVLAGYAGARPVLGGFEGEPSADGTRHGGWRDALPVRTQVDGALLFGESD